MSKIRNLDKFTRQYRSFGVVLIIFIIIAYLLIDRNDFFVNLSFIISSILVLSITYFVPSVFEKPYIIWMKFGLVLGNITSFIVLSIIFICIFTPIGIILRFSNVLGIKIKYENNKDTYWINRKDPIQSMKQQY